MLINILKLFFSIGLCLGVGVVGSFFTVDSIPTWYATLNKPGFNPPSWIFAPVWTTLYIMMGVSFYLVLSEKKKAVKRKAVQIFAVQLFLNAIWSIIFFGMQNPGLALIDIVALWAAIVFTIKYFYPISKLSTYLLYPYLAWVSFATILNLSIVLLNP